jgi:flagellar motor switch protein FliM
MKGDFVFVAERALANHSTALVRPGPDDSDLLFALGQAAARLARSLRGTLARLCGVDMLDIAIDPPRESRLADFATEGLCAYSTYSASDGGAGGPGRLISAIDAEAVLRLVDRAFGGPGEAPRPMPRELPMSAELMVQRIEAILAARLGDALGTHTTIQPLRRDTDLRQLQPFAPDTRLAVLDIAVSEGKRAPWPIRMAMPIAALPALTGMAGEPVDALRVPALPGDPNREPFAAVPVDLTALLIDTRVPLHLVTRLEVGQVLTLPIARQVPLIAGGTATGHVIGSGTIGAVDDRVAVQITQLA